MMKKVSEPFQIFRVSVPDGEYSRRADVVERVHYDALKSEHSDLLEVIQEVFIIGDVLVRDTYGSDFTNRAKKAIDKALASNS
jgi:hypothetical protein